MSEGLLVSGSPEHLPEGTMTKAIGRKRQLRETDGERGHICQGWRGKVNSGLLRSEADGLVQKVLVAKEVC